MTTHTAETSPLIYARVAGLLYLLPLAPFSLLYVPSRLVVPGDAAATASNIMASESLFRLGIVSNLLSQICMIFVSLLLYQLLKPVNKTMAVLMVIFNLLGVPIVMLNELNRLAVLLLLHGADALTVFTPAQLHARVPLFLDLHTLGLNIAGMFWGLWLFPMGYLVFKSGFLPRIIGVLLMIGCFGYLIQSLAAFLLPNLDVNIILFTSWGELLLALWLLIKGVNVERWEKRALAFT
jgi:hypothetical protein